MSSSFLDAGSRIWINETASPRTFEKRADVAGARRVAQFAQRLGLNLTNAFTGYGEHLANFFEGPLIAVLKPETHAEDAFLARAERLQHRGHLLLEAQVHGCLRWRDYGLVFDEIAQMSVFLFTDGSLEGYGRLSDLAGLANFFDGHVQPLGQLLRSGLAAKLLHELASALGKLIDDLDHVNGHTDRARLVSDGARDGLANPPGGVGGELVTASPVELVGAFHESEITFLDQIEKLQAVMGVFLGDRNNEAKVGFSQFFLGLDGLRFTSLDEGEGAFEAGQPNLARFFDLLQLGAARAQLLTSFGGDIA